MNCKQWNLNELFPVSPDNLVCKRNHCRKYWPSRDLSKNTFVKIKNGKNKEMHRIKTKFLIFNES